MTKYGPHRLSPPPSRSVMASFLFTNLGNKGRSKLVGWRWRFVYRETPSTTRACAYLISYPKTANHSQEYRDLEKGPFPRHLGTRPFTAVQGSMSSSPPHLFRDLLPSTSPPHTQLRGAFSIVKTACDCHASPRVSRRADYCPPPP